MKSAKFSMVLMLIFFIADFAFAGTILYDASDSDGNRHLWAIKDDGTQKTQLTFGEVEDYNPVCSPDGSVIAFVSTREGLGIYTYTITDQTITKIYSHTQPYGPGRLLFSDDGAKIYFYYGYQAGSGEYYSVPVDGGDIQPLTDFDENTRSLDISPDETKLVYSQQPGSDAALQEIYVSDFDGSNIVQLTDNGINDSQPKWSPNGLQVAWLERPVVAQAPRYLSIMNADGTGQSRIVEYPDSIVGGFDFSPAGQKIAYSVDIDGVRDVFVANIDGTGEINLTDDDFDANGIDWTPHLIVEWILPGTILYDASDSDGNRHLWAIKDDGTQKTQLTFGEVEDYNPVCSPDGSVIAFVSTREGLGIYTYTITDQTITKIYSHTQPYGPGRLLFSDDGAKIYFYYGYQAGSGEYYSVPVDGGDIQPLTDFDENTRSLDISPDETKLVYSQQPGSDAALQEIYVSDFDGSNIVQLTDNGINDSQPKWSPNGLQVAWLERPVVAQAPRYLSIMNADGTGQSRIVEYPDSIVGGFDFSPAGQKIAYSVDIDGVRDVFVANIDGTGEINLTDDDFDANGIDWTPHSIVEICLVAYYKFNGDAMDASGNGNHATGYNGVTFSQGVDGQAASFDGDDDHFRVPYSPELITPTWTISAWIYAENLPDSTNTWPRYKDSHRIINTDETTANYHATYAISIKDQDFGIPSYLTATYETANSETNIGPRARGIYAHKWYFITYTRGAEGYSRLYIDGELVDSVFNEQVPTLLPQDVLIGQSPNAFYEDCNFDGYIDELRIYNCAFSAKKIRMLYDSYEDPNKINILPSITLLLLMPYR